MRFYVKSLNVHPDVVQFLGLQIRGPVIFKSEKTLGMLERLEGLGEIGRQRMTKGASYVSDTLRVYVWKFRLDQVKETSVKFNPALTLINTFFQLRHR